MVRLQERNFLLLKNDEYHKFIKYILESPLNLARKLIIYLNENNYEELKNELDIIKQFVAGIKRAEEFKEYKLAAFYPTMFAFHQFFHSSFRARQGKVLERVIQEILRRYTDSNKVPRKVNDMQGIIKEIYKLPEQLKLDIDALGIDEKNKKVIIIQLRSRDDTGGTTAKGSLVDFLRDLLREHKTSNYELLYLIAVWDERDSSQKKSTKSKIYSSLRENISVNESEFYQKVDEGIELSQNIFLKMAYGVDEILQALFNWSSTDNPDVLNSIKNITRTINNWDDLWVSYAISSLELELNLIHSVSNFELLNFYLKKEKISLDDINNLSGIDMLSLQIASNWKENTIPLPSVSDKIHYIRDLLFLKKIYIQINK